MKFNLLRRNRQSKDYVSVEDVPPEFNRFCEICGNKTHVRLSVIGTYFVECSKDKLHYQKFWKNAKRYNPATGERIVDV